MKSILTTALIMLLSVTVFSQNIGLGTTDPQYKLDIFGSCRISSNAYIGGYMGIGTTSPAYKMTLQDGTFAFYNSFDNKYWLSGYSSGSNNWYLAEDGITRMVIANGGNVGIGTSSPSAKLDVVGNAEISGNLTVNNGDGILRNAAGATQLKYYTFTGAFGFTNFSGNTVSGPHHVNFPAAADFNSTPRVMTGNYTYIFGTAGKLFSIIPSIYSVSSTGFDIYFFNSSPSTATMDFTITFICIGS